ncbi:unnamed protein product [Mesocestoides corti]|uniref:Secreted protein n=1 Tax=Mesocestoides corti TaxID=53468 RepID=A0A0R3U566_MESCO|nr:unnamed protein product [Mesocestoides corti]
MSKDASVRIPMYIYGLMCITCLTATSDQGLCFYRLVNSARSGVSVWIRECGMAPVESWLRSLFGHLRGWRVGGLG